MLLASNERFAAGMSEHPNQDAARRAEVAPGQRPFAVVFGCSDSRLAAEIIFDRGLGDLFVVRTAGHVMGPEVLGSIEYGVDVPGPILLELRILGDLVEIVVWDSDPVLPIARAADAGRVGQHGLEIVMAVVQGFDARREPVGKRITARLALADDPGGAITGHRPL
ncbi:carbonic anhydrase [Streptomyces sp. NPDC014684]|uniref:carbonic anhydrase n=1 Tax=Streptomyces sp. NPDC014684 TaxID=3364880 RepID=UPI00370180B7